MASSSRRRWPAFVGFGTLLVASAAVETAVHATSGGLTISFVAGIAMSVPFALVPVIGGFRLRRTDLPERLVGRITTWTVGSTVVFGVFIAIFALTSYTDPWLRFASIRWGLSLGAGGGFLVGYLNARSIKRMLDAELAALEADEAQRQQHILEYVNSILRHEVLNTVNVIEGYAEMLEAGQAEAPGDTASIIARQSRQMAAVTEDVRVLIQSTQDGETREPMDVAMILRQELEYLTDRYPEARTSHTLPDEAYVMADALLRRLFSNLLNNAVEHNDSTPPRVALSVTVTDETVAVRIEDNGPGIPEGQREDLFDPVPPRDSTHGLGLTIVARLTRGYDGGIELTETGEDGTVFTIEFPRTTRDGGDPPAPPSPPPTENVQA